jgi:nanoRNase/pAp phosphatase (c-di-AMP/oligoRNAs hydrolase)
MMQERLRQLLEAVGEAEHVLILPHNDPDPDAIAGAVALRYLLVEKLGVECLIAYEGIIGRAENRALVRYLGNPLQRLQRNDLNPAVPVALLDTQPGTGNNPLAPGAAVTIVIDHHPLLEETATAPFADVRPDVGATSTLLTEYLQAAKIEPTKAIATALFYGIKTDTMGLARNATSADTAAYFYLLPLIDVEALVKIERAQVPPEYFKSLAVTMQTARLYDGVVIAYLGPTTYPDLAAEMADLLLRLQGTKWVICMGLHNDTLFLSVRTRSARGGCRQLARAMVQSEGMAGGHGLLAGGQVPVDGRDPDEMAARFTQRALQYLKIPPEIEGKPII